MTTGAMSQEPIDVSALGSSASTSAAPQGSRPYRSHRFPACDFCRRRKSRCTRDLDNRPCLLCRVNGVECTQTQISNGGESSPAIGGVDGGRDREAAVPVHRKKRPRVSASEIQMEESMRKSPVAIRSQDSALMDVHFSNPQTQSREERVAPQMDYHTPRSVPTPQQTQSQTQTGHIVGPAVARDVQVLEQYMSPTYGGLAVSYARPNPYSVYSDDPRHPIVYLKVPRQRVITSLGNGSAGFKQYEIMERILEPLGNDLFGL